MVYNIVIWHYYTFQYDHYTNSSNHLLLCKLITILLTIFSFPLSTHLPTSTLLVTMQLVCFYASVFIFCFIALILCSTYIWNHTVFVFYCLIYFLSIVPSRFIHALANSKISFFFTVVYSIIYIPIFQNIKIHWFHISIRCA